VSSVLGAARIAGVVRRAAMGRPMRIAPLGLHGDVLERSTLWCWEHHAAI